MAKTPFPPFEVRLLPDKFGAGMDNAPTKRTGADVWHRMVGTLKGTDAYFRLDWVHASTHWGIGGSLDGPLDGVIYQWVKMGSNRRPWASGPWREPGFGDGSAFVRAFGIDGINGSADSIEFSGMTDTPMTEKQWQKGMWLSAAIHHAGGQFSHNFEWNMHHREFCQPSYKDCCFWEVYRYTEEYQRGIVNIMAHYEGKTDVEDFVKIGNLYVPLPFNQKPKPPTNPKPIFVSFDKPYEAELVKGATYRQYGNTQARIYSVAESGQLEQFDGYYIGQMVNGLDRWYVTDNPLHERIHSSGIKRWIENPKEV